MLLNSSAIELGFSNSTQVHFKLKVNVFVDT